MACDVENIISNPVRYLAILLNINSYANGMFFYAITAPIILKGFLASFATSFRR